MRSGGLDVLVSGCWCLRVRADPCWCHLGCLGVGCVSPRPISTRPLSPLPGVHAGPINPMVCGGPYPIVLVGDLISKRVSRLDAFSGYPFRT